MDEKYVTKFVGATEIMRHVLADSVGTEVENLVDLNGVEFTMWLGFHTYL